MRGFAIEGTGSYGASLTRHLQGAGQFVVEATRPRRDRMAHRNDGKSDTKDALRAAKALLAEELAVAPKQRDGDVEALGTLQVWRSAVKSRTSAINAMRAVLVTAPDRLRDQFRGATNVLIETVLPASPGNGLDASILRALRQLARRCKSLTEEIVEADEEIDRLVRRRAPQS